MKAEKSDMIVWHEEGNYEKKLCGAKNIKACMVVYVLTTEYVLDARGKVLFLGFYL